MANDGSRYYTWGDPKWDSDKMPYTNKGASQTTQNILWNDDLNSYSGLACPDVVIETNKKSFSVITTAKALNVEISKITSIDRHGATVLTIKTRDEVPLNLGFKDSKNLESVEDRLFRVMNGGADVGCVISDNSGGDFNNDYNEDFN